MVLGRWSPNRKKFTSARSRRPFPAPAPCCRGIQAGFLGNAGFARHRLLEEDSWAAIVASFRDGPVSACLSRSFPFSSPLVAITTQSAYLAEFQFTLRSQPNVLLRAGVDLNTIRAWLGHVSLDTTNIYAETDLALKAKALAACDPGGGRRRSKKKWRDNPDVMEFLRKL